MIQNAIILEGALNRMVNAQAVAQKWITYNGNKSVDAVSARDWVRANVTFDPKAIGSALNQTHASGWAFGEQDAQQELTSSVGFDWDTWNPGNEAAAMLVDPPNGLKELMAQNGVTIKGLSDTNIDRIGTALAIGLDQGLTVTDTAKAVNYVVANPARALVIARTETARALVQSNLATYRDAQVESVEWLVADPCKICAQNGGVVVPLGEAFPSGDTEPPAHPNCVCDVAPVLSDVSESFAPSGGEGDGVESVSPDGEDTVIHGGVIDESPIKSIKADGYVANAGMKTAAQRAIDWRKQGHRGGTQVGATRARQIVSGEKMSADTVKRMYSFFSRHEVDKKATGFHSGEDGYPSPGRVAWDLWGGDAGYSWSRQIVERLKREEG